MAGSKKWLQIKANVCFPIRLSLFVPILPLIFPSDLWLIGIERGFAVTTRNFLNDKGLALKFFKIINSVNR
jgi:hypothetical protein